MFFVQDAKIEYVSFLYTSDLNFYFMCFTILLQMPYIKLLMNPFTVLDIVMAINILDSYFL